MIMIVYIPQIRGLNPFYIVCILFWAFGANIVNAQDSDWISADSGGTIMLTAETGKAIGPDIKYMPEWNAFGWFTDNDRVEWEVDVPHSGKYEVFLDWSVSDEEAGKRFLFQAGDETLVKKVGKTGSWETFKTKKVGTIKLSTGKQTMIFKAYEEFKEGEEALLDLRSIKLKRLK